MPVNLLSHPVVQSKISILRQTDQSSAQFRAGIAALSTCVGYEASKGLELRDVPDLKSPMASFTGKAVTSKIGLVPILRAGLGMEGALLELFPDAPVYHIGLFREKVSLQAVEYYSRLPAAVTVDEIFILDPLIATAATAIAAVTMIREWGLPVEKVKFLAILASQQGLDALQKAFPNLQIYVCALDPTLTNKGYISPGLGDTGDRLYSTQ